MQGVKAEGAKKEGIKGEARQKSTRIQREKRELILQAALDVFATNGFRGSTMDQVAEQAGMSKPNLFYYFASKEAIHRQLLDRLLEQWLEPLRELDPQGEPLDEIRAYISRKLELARDFPRESRLFANEILQGAPRILDELDDLRDLVDEKAKIIQGWIAAGRLAPCDPRHLIFSIWATTQHYADFDVQVRRVLQISEEGDGHFDDAKRYLHHLFTSGLKAG